MLKEGTNIQRGITSAANAKSSIAPAQPYLSDYARSLAHKLRFGRLARYGILSDASSAVARRRGGAASVLVGLYMGGS
jgi:hypothetical protein